MLVGEEGRVRALACRAIVWCLGSVEGVPAVGHAPCAYVCMALGSFSPPTGVVFNQHKITLMNPLGVRQWNMLVALRGWVGLAEPGGRARRYRLAVLRCPPASWLLSTFEACRIRCCCDSEQDSS